MSAVDDHGLLPAWDDAVHAAQATFRCVLDALAEPGSIHALPVDIQGPAPLGPALTALCLALADAETPLWCDRAASERAVGSYLRFHCGSPLTAEQAQAVFALIVEPENLMLAGFARGSMEYPDRSATLLVQVPSLSDGPARALSGPGIPHARTLRVAGLPADFDTQWQANAAGFPLGVDLVFCCDGKIAGLPRTTRIQTV